MAKKAEPSRSSNKRSLRPIASAAQLFDLGPSRPGGAGGHRGQSLRDGQASLADAFATVDDARSGCATCTSRSITTQLTTTRRGATANLLHRKQMTTSRQIGMVTSPGAAVAVLLDASEGRAGTGRGKQAHDKRQTWPGARATGGDRELGRRAKGILTGFEGRTGAVSTGYGISDSSAAWRHGVWRLCASCCSYPMRCAADHSATIVGATSRARRSSGSLCGVSQASVCGVLRALGRRSQWCPADGDSGRRVRLVSV